MIFETHNVYFLHLHYARTLNVLGYMSRIEDTSVVRITERVSKKIGVRNKLINPPLDDRFAVNI